MKGAKRYIVLLLAAVYCFAAGGPALASLMCRCMTSTAVDDGAFCCCVRHGGESSSVVLDNGPCCSDRHSTDVDLYTCQTESLEKNLKRPCVVDLPEALVAAAPVLTVTPEWSVSETVFSTEPRVRSPWTCSAVALRAPPAACC